MVLSMKNSLFLLVLALTTLACTINLGVVEKSSGKGVVGEFRKTEPTTVVKSVVVGTVNVRSCASSSCGVVGYLYPGQSVVAECSGNWCEVENGFVFSPCLGQKGICK